MANDEKAKLYKQITRDATDWQILERMQENGFWPYDKDIPKDPAAEAKEKAEIESQLVKLRGQSTVVKDPVKALDDERKRRMAESKKRRAEARAKRIADAQKRRGAWDVKRKSSVVHLGLGVSAGLEHTQSDLAALAARGLPAMHTGVDVAKMLSIPLSQLRWLTYHRRGAALVHYHRFGIPKKTGGTRYISAPKRRLSAAQRWVFKNILERLVPSPSAHGFVRHRSIVTNATPHVGRAVVVNMDLKDFFPSITFRRVKGLFCKAGYSEHVATVLSLLCTESPRVESELDGRKWFIALGDRVLPQGACTSPALTNVLCRRLDARLNGLATKHGFTYTRYADDLTFSGDKPAVLGRLVRSIRAILTSEGLKENESKTKILHQSQHQEVTGTVVNSKVGVPREELRALRAILHNAARHGLASQNRENHPDFAAHLRGRVAFMCNVDPERAPTLQKALQLALAAATANV